MATTTKPSGNPSSVGSGDNSCGDVGKTRKSSKSGPLPKSDEEKLVAYTAKILPEEVKALTTIQLSHNIATRRELLKYFISLEGGSQKQSTPVKNTEVNFQQPSRLPSPIQPPTAPGGAAATVRRVPVYAGGCDTFSRELELDIDDSDVEDLEYDTYDFLVNEELRIETGQHPMHGDSFNISDGQGRLLHSPPPKELNSWTENVARMKELEPIEYDYSDSTRLLPLGYYKEFSNGKQVRLHVGKKAVVSKDGILVTPPVGAARTQRQKTMDALDIVKDGRYIVEFHQLLKLISSKCYVSSCNASNNLDPNFLKNGIRRVGGVLVITVKCFGSPLVHEFKWTSARKLQHFEQSKAQCYSLNVLLSSSILVSGNSIARMHLFFKAMNIRVPSKEHYRRVQKLIATPVIEECWRMEQDHIARGMKENNFRGIFAADGQFDSPGFCATYLTYVQMLVELEREEKDKELYSEKTAYVVDISLTEKRHTGLKSTSMEVSGFLRSMLALHALDVSVSELVTDQHLKILSLMESAKSKPAEFMSQAKEALANFEDMNEDMYQRLLYCCRNTKHQLDIWHRKKVGRERKKLLLPWIPSVKNHFWYVARSCKGNVELMKAKWTSMVHHIAGVHSWSGGECDHEELEPAENRPPELPKTSKTYEVIRKAVTSPELLKNMHYYANFRHTGVLESFNAIQLRYTPKLLYFSYSGMLTRKLLCAMDHNDAVHRAVIRDRDGRVKVGKIYSKKSNSWVPKIRKVPKAYSHISHLLARILHEVCITPFRLGLHQRYNIAVQNDPSKLAPNTAKVQTPLADVLRHRKSRFAQYVFAANRNDALEDEDEEECLLDVEVDGIDDYGSSDVEYNPQDYSEDASDVSIEMGL